MPIYDIFEKEPIQADLPFGADFQPQLTQPKDHLFSSIAARLFFFLLLCADLVWALYSLTLTLLTSLLSLLTLLKSSYFKASLLHFWLSLKRSLVCALSLLVALFSPAFGIMIACTYFLMYDKAGIEEVVPQSLQAQFKQFFQPE